MSDEQKIVVIGSWVDAVGTIVSAYGEVRELAGKNEINDLIIAIGEGLQAIGGSIIGTVPADDMLGFAGNWIDSVGAAGASLGSYLQYTEGVNNDNIIIETLGDSFQSLGSFMSGTAEYEAGEDIYALGSALQGIGAGLEALAGVLDLYDRSREAQPISTIGAILQAAGSNINAIKATKELESPDNYNDFSYYESGMLGGILGSGNSNFNS